MRLLILSLAVITSFGCSSLHTLLPANRFESPETNGTEHRVGLQAAVSSAHDYTVTSDASRRPPDLTRPTIDQNAMVLLNGSFGLLHDLDLSIRGAVGPSPTLFQVKYQIFGVNHRTAKNGDTSVAITGAIGGGRNTKAGDQSGTFGPAALIGTVRLKPARQMSGLSQARASQTTLSFTSAARTQTTSSVRRSISINPMTARRRLRAIRFRQRDINEVQTLASSFAADLAYSISKSFTRISQRLTDQIRSFKSAVPSASTFKESYV